MKVLILQERNPDVQGGAESWVNDTRDALRLRGYQLAWLYSDQIKRAVDTFRPDVVLMGTLHNFVGLRAVEYLAEHQVPAVWFLHDYWPFCGPRMLMRNNNRSDQCCAAVVGDCDNGCGGRRAVPEVLGRFHTVTGCEGAAAILRRNGVRVDGVVEEGIDTDLFKPGAKEPPTTVYASCAWDAPWKGMHTLTRALLGTGLRLSLLTGLTRAQVATELQKASIYVMPSLYQEIWGLGLTEAMASGCACVATDVAGLRAQIAVHGEHVGLLVQPHDVANLRDAILHLVRESADRDAMGERARQHVVKSHSLAALGERWAETFGKVLEGVTA